MHKNRLEILDSPKFIELKEKILNLEGIKKGFNLAKEEIVRLLNEREEDIMLALASLIREGKLPSSSVIADAGSGEVIVQSFGKGDKVIRFQGEET